MGKCLRRQRWWSPGLGDPHPHLPFPFWILSGICCLQSTGWNSAEGSASGRLALLDWGSSASATVQPFLGSPLCHKEP